MIIASDTNTVERFGVQTENSFKIKASAKAFQILSSGLYSDKQTAIIREVLANAWDSHVAAHNPVPVKLHLPNSFEPWLSIRDFGTGLSDHQINTIYTTYFESTKADSNDFTGCLGLGSKSPFSYVDNFTVVSYFDGVKRTYSAFIDENGVPAIALLNEEPTTEHNGMEVQLAVKTEDFEDFRVKTQRVVRRFRGQVEVVGNSNYSTNSIEYGLSGNGWALRTGDDKDGDVAFALMGNIGYPIRCSDTSLTAQQRVMLALPIDIDFAIGDLDIAASREALSYDLPTINNIKAALDRIVVELRDRVAQEFVSCTSLWAARCLAQEVFTGKYRKFSSLVQDSAPLMWQGQKIAWGNVAHGSKLDVSVFVPSTSRRGRYGSAGKTKVAMERTRDVVTSHRSKFIYDDLVLGSFTRCKEIVLAGNADQVYLFRPSSEPLSTQPVQPTLTTQPPKLPYPTAQEQLATFKANLGLLDSDIILASSLPKPPRKPRTITAKGAARVLVWNGRSTSSPSSQWEIEAVDMQQGGIYVPLTRYEITADYRSENPYDYIADLSTIMDNAGLTLDLNTIKIVGVKANRIDKFRNEPNWVTLAQYCKQQVEAALLTTNLSNVLALSTAYANFNTSHTYVRAIATLNAQDFKQGCPFRNFLEAFNSAKNSHCSKTVALDTAAKRLKVLVPPAVAPFDLDELYRLVEAAYPMIKGFRYMPYDATKAMRETELDKYIQSIDK